MTVQCCVCRKVRVAGEWTQNSMDASLQLSHSYCPVCLGETQAQFEAERMLMNSNMAIHAVT